MSEDVDMDSRPSRVPQSRARIDLPRDGIDDFCRRRHIRKLALFGSVLRDDFTADSDVDVLVEFEPRHVPGLMTLAGIEEDLSQHLGQHRVDMNTRMMLSKYFRDEVVAEAEVLYDQT